MSDVQELLGLLPIDQLASQVGAEPSEVAEAVSNALPALLMGLGANAQDPAGEASILSALNQHSPSLLSGGVEVGQIDVSDGQKITQHIFGDQEESVAAQLGGLGGGQGLIQKLLPYLAPIVMSWLAGKLMGSDERQGQSAQTQSSDGGLLGGILGQILGEGTSAGGSTAPQLRLPDNSTDSQGPTIPLPNQSQQQSSSDGGLGGGILGQILGGLLGGGRR